MDKVRNGEDLRQRLVMAAGEDMVAWGWGTLGTGNVFTGVTTSALVLEFVTMGMKTKELRRIPFEEMEFIYAAKGDASTPGYLKLNIEARVADSMTGTLILKPMTDGLMYIRFSKLPRHEKNDQAPFRITEYITQIVPDKVFLPDLSQYRPKSSFSGCLKTFMIIAAVTTVLIALLMGFGTGEWDLAVFGGIGTGVVLGAVFAPLVPLFKRMLSGRG
jgi:hypothetical protein